MTYSDPGEFRGAHEADSQAHVSPVVPENLAVLEKQIIPHRLRRGRHPGLRNADNLFFYSELHGRG